MSFQASGKCKKDPKKKCCSKHSECPKKQVCLHGACTVKKCTVTSDCPECHFCCHTRGSCEIGRGANKYAAGRCVRKPCCDSDADCAPLKKVCKNRVCLRERDGEHAQKAHEGKSAAPKGYGQDYDVDYEDGHGKSKYREEFNRHHHVKKDGEKEGQDDKDEEGKDEKKHHKKHKKHHKKHHQHSDGDGEKHKKSHKKHHKKKEE